MNQFTIITKDGSKWLRPSLGTATHLISPDLPYLGSRPEGTTVDEGEVKEVVKYRQKDNENADWKIWTTGVIDWDCVIETRTVYTDAESHDRHISDNPRYPLFSHMSSEHGLTLLDSELDEIARHAAPMTGVDYWKRRCKAAERFIEQSPCDPDITPKQIEAHEVWQEIIEEGGAYGN